MRYVMTLGEFLFLKQEATKNDEITAIAETDATDGSIDTYDVMIAYHYDGVALQFNVTKKHTLASKVASDQYIERHIDEVLAEVLATANQVITQPVAIVEPVPTTEVEPVTPV